jgi:hypothetical protein
MKCIHCDSDTNFKTRQSNGLRCGACRHPFAFEPRGNILGMNDRRFQRILRNVSGDGTLSFTERELWYEFNRNIWREPIWKAPWGGIAAALGASSLAAAMAAGSGWPLLIGLAGVIGSGVISRRSPRQGNRRPRIDWPQFLSDYLARWYRAHGSIERLLPSPVPRPAPEKHGIEPDVTAYSFDRALVTDKAETAAMLVANNFHFENNCAILSADGYPHDRAGTIMGMLRRNPQLKVFALHDATPQGCGLPRTLRGEQWFPDPAIRITDLGLLPRHAQKMALFTLAGGSQSVPAEVRSLLTPEETTWLAAGESAEVAALRPARLMRAIYQGFARAGQVGTDGATGDGGVIWFYDSGADIYAADSFG